MSGDSVAKQHERDGGSLTVTFGNGPARRVAVFVGAQRQTRKTWAGGRRDAARAAVAHCRALGPDWRILSISSPVTIYRDLIGRDPNYGGLPTMPEVNILPRAAHDVLADRLRGSSERAERNHRTLRPGRGGG